MSHQLRHETRAPLATRLTRHFTVAAASAVVASAAFADVQYSAVNWTVPANIDGLYINVETLATGSAGSVVAGWDINPYSATSLTWFNATGTGMMRFPGVTTGSAGNLALGTIVGPSGSYGSGAVLVSGATGHWQVNSLNRFGFRFVASDGQTHYGWGSFEIPATINGATRRITEIAWETAPGVAITVGDVGGGSGPYDPCAVTNPVANVGSNSLFVRNTDIADLDLGACGLLYKANYYKFVSPTTRTYDISTCEGAGSTILAVLDDCSSTANVVSCGESCGAAGSTVTLSATAGVTYYIVLGSSDGADLATPYGIQVTPWYDPCATSNPTLGNATTTVALNTTTAQDLVVGGKGCGFTIYDANYFRYTAPTAGTYTINTCSSAQDTRIALLDGCGAGANVLACNDNSCGASSSITVELTTATYYLVVGGASPKSQLTSPLDVTVVPPPIEACVNAAPAIFGDNPFTNNGPVAQTVKSNAAGTTTATMQRVVWYTFVPGATGAYSLRTCGAVSSGTAAADTMLAIGTVCPTVGSRFEAIAFNDDAPNCSSGGTGNLASFIDATNNGATGTFAGFPLTQDLIAGQTYYIAVGSYSATTNLSGTLVIDGPPQGNPADLDGDGTVGAADLSLLLAAWGTAGPGDLDGDGDVGAADLSILLAAWGT